MYILSVMANVDQELKKYVSWMTLSWQQDRGVKGGVNSKRTAGGSWEAEKAGFGLPRKREGEK